MIEIYPRLFIGAAHDYETKARLESGWSVVHACKEPYHRNLLGYTGRGAPKNHPEYLIATRGNRLFLNLVDADDSRFIPREIIDGALAFSDEALRSGEKLLIHCNQGESRAPSLGLLYLAARTDALPAVTFAEAEARFQTIYPPYRPKGGMRGFVQQHWREYVPMSFIRS